MGANRPCQRVTARVALVSGTLLMTELALTHLLGHRVFPLRLSGDLDCAIRPECQRRVRVCRPRLYRYSTGRLLAIESLVYAVATLVALFFLVRLRVG